MGFLAGRDARPRAQDWAPWDSRWYAPIGLQTEAGVRISADTVLMCGTVLAALRFKAEAFAMCPPKVYRELPGDRRELDRQHYLFRVLRKPNAWQTGFNWRGLMQVWLNLWGNAHNRIIWRRDGVTVDEIRPLHPLAVRVLSQNGDGALTYEYDPRQDPTVSKQDRRSVEQLGQDEMLHFRGLSTDGISGVVTYQLLRNVVGIALAAEKHAAVFLRKGTRLSGVLSTKEPFPEDVQKRAEDSWIRNFGGSENEGSVAIMGGGLEFKPLTTDHRNAQFLELRDFQVGEILRFLGVPGVVVGYAEKTATYASADAFFEKGGIKHCLMPSVINMEEEIDYSLLLEKDPHYSKFSLDVLLRANTKDRYESLSKATGRPWLTGNEVRRIEDLNPMDDDPSMDKVLMPSNMAGEAEPSEPAPPPAPARPGPMPPPDDAGERDDDDPEPRQAASAAPARLAVLAKLAAGQVVRREIAAITERAPKKASDVGAWRKWVSDYYGRHAAHVAKALEISADKAQAYCDRQAAALLADGVAVVQTWEASVVPQLAALAQEAR